MSLSQFVVLAECNLSARLFSLFLFPPHYPAATTPLLTVEQSLASGVDLTPSECNERWSC